MLQIDWMWLKEWSDVIQGILTVLLTGALVYLYYQQKNVLERQENIMSKQREISASQQATMASEYQPRLFLLQYDFRRDRTDCLYRGRISNEGHDLAQEISVRSMIFVTVEDDATEYRVSGCQSDSFDQVTSLSDIEFLSDISVVPLFMDNEVSIKAPFYIEDIPSPVQYFRTNQDRDMQKYAVSFLKPGEACDISGPLRYTINRKQASDGIPLELSKVLKILQEKGFNEVHIWIGVQYLDGLGNEQRLTLHTRTLKLIHHYTKNPIEEWGRCDMAKELNEIQSTDPRRDYVLDKQ